MSKTRTRLALAGTLALAFGALVGPGTAQAAKVTETAAGGLVPNATGGGGLATSEGLLTQTFSLKGKKVKKKQLLDVTLTLNVTGSAPGAVGDLRATLVGPSGEPNGVPMPGVQSLVNLKYDSKVDTRFCNPFTTVASDCLYPVGAIPGTPGSGSLTGSLTNNFNATYKGSNPKGTWTLKVFDTDPNAPGTPVTSVLGTSTLEVKTGKKFAKEDK